MKNYALNLKPTNLYQVLEALIERFNEQLLDSDRTILLDCPNNLPFVMVDSDRLEQILVNLLSNAIRHTPQGLITLKVWSETDKIWLSITDTGSGISTDELPHVFRRFWRSQRNLSEKYAGTGIGLAICQRLVEIHQGEISVESQLGVGATFKFFLPLNSIK